MDTTPLPLDDIRVVELGQLLAGPFCGQLLGDFGAEVIKVEDPANGDPMRQWGREKPYGKSLWWPVVARNKKSVTANLRTERGAGPRPPPHREGRRTRSRTSGRARSSAGGSPPKQLWEINPGLVVTRVTGFGQTGPYAARAGYGSIGEAMGGIRYVTGDPDRPPARAGISLGDSLAATFAALGTLVALHQRGRTGRGQVVDSAIYEAVLAMMESLLPEWQIAGYQRERTGTTLPNVSPSNVYPTADGEMVLIAANQDTVFRRLAEVMGRPEPGDRRALRDPQRARPAHGGARRHDRRVELDRQGRRPARAAPRRRRPGRAGSSARRTCSPTRTSRRGRRSSGSPTPSWGSSPCTTSRRSSPTPRGGSVTSGPSSASTTKTSTSGLLGLDDDAMSSLRSAGVI